MRDECASVVIIIIAQEKNKGDNRREMNLKEMRRRRSQVKSGLQLVFAPDPRILGG